MELNGRQYQTSRLLTQKLYLGSMNCFHMGTEGNRKTYTTIWLWLDLCQSPLLLPEGGGKGGQFPMCGVTDSCMLENGLGNHCVVISIWRFDN